MGHGALAGSLGPSPITASANLRTSRTSSSTSRSSHPAKIARPIRSRAESTASVMALPFGVTMACSGADFGAQTSASDGWGRTVLIESDRLIRACLGHVQKMLEKVHTRVATTGSAADDLNQRKMEMG